MKLEKVLGIVLFLIGAVIFVALISSTSFAKWFEIDVATIAVCGLIGFFKKLKSLIAVAVMITAGIALNIPYPLWVLVDLVTIGICVYAGLVFFNALPKFKKE